MKRQRRRLSVQPLETRKLMAGDIGNNEITISQDDQVADGTSNTLMVGEVYTGTINADANVSFDDFESRRDSYIVIDFVQHGGYHR